MLKFKATVGPSIGSYVECRGGKFTRASLHVNGKRLVTILDCKSDEVSRVVNPFAGFALDQLARMMLSNLLEHLRAHLDEIRVHEETATLGKELIVTRTKRLGMKSVVLANRLGMQSAVLGVEGLDLGRRINADVNYQRIVARADIQNSCAFWAE